jgi:predicted transcriptional regulator
MGCSFKQQVEKGLRDVAEGRTISNDEMKTKIAEWRKSAGRQKRDPDEGNSQQ